jgi:hypothetical protein
MISSLHLEFYLNVCQGRAIVVWIKATVRGVCFRLAQVVAPTPTCRREMDSKMDKAAPLYLHHIYSSKPSQCTHNFAEANVQTTPIIQE